MTGGAAPTPGCVMVDTKRLDRIGPLDDPSGLVTVEPGVIGQNLEEWLGARGWTLGHFPSSITISSIGGFAAARSVGQCSTKYGTFASMVAGLTAVLPDGTVVQRRPNPASAAGPDLIGVLLGSEGTLGLITQAGPAHPPGPRGDCAARVPAPVLRRRAGDHSHRAAAGTAARRGPPLRRGGHGPVPSRGRRRLPADHDVRGVVAAGGARGEALGQAVAAQEGVDLGEEPGRSWHERRYEASYRLADYLKPGGTFGDAVAVDTLEVAASWQALPATYAAVRDALAATMDLVLCHAGHAYTDGACLYFTFGAAGHGDEAAVRERYEAAWAAAMPAAAGAGATITHHHGVGLLRAPWLRDELGGGGFQMLERIKAALDPALIANPGKARSRGDRRVAMASLPVLSDVAGAAEHCSYCPKMCRYACRRGSHR